MRKTVHFEKRMSQRGINKDVVQLVMEYGEQQGDKLILSRKAAERLMHAARTLAKILDKGGLVVVAAGESQLTTYNYEGRSH